MAGKSVQEFVYVFFLTQLLFCSSFFLFSPFSVCGCVCWFVCTVCWRMLLFLLPCPIPSFAKWLDSPVFIFAWFSFLPDRSLVCLYLCVVLCVVLSIRLHTPPSPTITLGRPPVKYLVFRYTSLKCHAARDILLRTWGNGWRNLFHWLLPSILSLHCNNVRQPHFYFKPLNSCSTEKKFTLVWASAVYRYAL